MIFLLLEILFFCLECRLLFFPKVDTLLLAFDINAALKILIAERKSNLPYSPPKKPFLISHQYLSVKFQTWWGHERTALFSLAVPFLNLHRKKNDINRVDSKNDMNFSNHYVIRYLKSGGGRGDPLAFYGLDFFFIAQEEGEAHCKLKGPIKGDLYKIH